ncbi:MAG TPA: prenyltransferase [Nocardioidaceae bacterium]|nr:prenyltransferase [Nocardioidaceae bacterium]
MRTEIPGLPGVLGADAVARTAASIAAVQEPDGAIPTTAGGATDAWNHVEAAMALLVGGQPDAAGHAYDWCLSTQRGDGSWPTRLIAGTVEDASAESNMAGYLAVGVWHHWLVRRDQAFVRRMWPAVHRALELVVALQLGFGGISWVRDEHGHEAREALLTGSASLFHALRAGLALADLMDAPQPDWELAAGRLEHALSVHPDRFADKSWFSMDWYYPVLGGAVRGTQGQALLAARWDDFVVPGLGVRCVDTNPWVTGAETCELALALDALGDRDAARQLLRDVQRLRDESGGYWTGYVYADHAIWPVEHTTYTAAAVVLAVDALTCTTGGSDIFRGSTLPAGFAPIGLECGCWTPEPGGVATGSLRR